MSVVFVKSVARVEDLPPTDRPHIAMVGRSNVGKSSLINDLCGQKDLARVSAEPGRTRLINLFDVDGRFFLVDLPGYGYAKSSKERRQGYADLIEAYLWQAKQLSLVLLLTDARVGATELDRNMIDTLSAAAIPFVIVANKIDKLSRSESTNLMRQLDAGFQGISVIPHSAITGAGKGEIRSAIDQAIKMALSNPAS